MGDAGNGEAENSGERGHDRLLAGLRIIDAGQVIAGPFVGTLLADLGAEVIRVELPALKDQSQALENSARAGEQRNKKSVSLDLRMPEGAALFKRAGGLGGCGGGELLAGNGWSAGGWGSRTWWRRTLGSSLCGSRGSGRRGRTGTGRRTTGSGRRSGG